MVPVIHRERGGRGGRSERREEDICVFGSLSLNYPFLTGDF
jgi:hypothetical protein